MTHHTPDPTGRQTHFNPHFPRGGDLAAGRGEARAAGISIYTSPKGGDDSPRQPRTTARDFNPHLPRREVTRPSRISLTRLYISIHTSPKGGDHVARHKHNRRGISIHTSPKGGDMRFALVLSMSSGFQSTPPRREVTRGCRNGPSASRFQSTPPRREVTPRPWDQSHNPEFQSTPPRREVTLRVAEGTRLSHISIHTSPKGGDGSGCNERAGKEISIHTSPKGGDQTTT